MSVNHLYVVAVAAIFGCAAGASGKSATARMGNVLNGEEITATHADVATAYDAVARLRPNWLAPRAAMAYAWVFVDGQPYGDLNTLRNIPAYNVASIRYYDVTQSTARFGTRGGSAGAIDVTMKSR